MKAVLVIYIISFATQPTIKQIKMHTILQDHYTSYWWSTET